MTGDRHSKHEDNSTFHAGWQVIERTWADRPVTRAEKRAAAVDPDFKREGDKERRVALVATEAMADALLGLLSGQKLDVYDVGVWY